MTDWTPYPYPVLQASPNLWMENIIGDLVLPMLMRLDPESVLNYPPWTDGSETIDAGDVDLVYDGIRLPLDAGEIYPGIIGGDPGDDPGDDMPEDFLHGLWEVVEPIIANHIDVKRCLSGSSFVAGSLIQDVALPRGVDTPPVGTQGHCERRGDGKAVFFPVVADSSVYPPTCEVEDDFSYTEDPLATNWNITTYAEDEAQTDGTKAFIEKQALNAFSTQIHKTALSTVNHDVRGTISTDGTPNNLRGYVIARANTNDTHDDLYVYGVKIGAGSTVGREFRRVVNGAETIVSQVPGPGQQTSWEIRLVVDDYDPTANIRCFDRPYSEAAWQQKIATTDYTLSTGYYAGFGLQLHAATSATFMGFDDFCAMALTPDL